MPEIMERISRYLYSRKTMVFYEYLYEKSSVRLEPHDGLVFRTLEPSDYPDLSSFLALQKDLEPVFKPIDLGEAMVRLADGEACYICRNPLGIIGYTWFAKGKKYIPEIQSTIRLGPSDLYLHNAYISKANRRKDAFSGIIKTERKDSLWYGFTREITATMAWNKPAAGSLLKLNFHSVGRVTVGFFLTFRYMINTCKDISFVDEAGAFTLHARLFKKLRASTGDLIEKVVRYVFSQKTMVVYDCDFADIASLDFRQRNSFVFRELSFPKDEQSFADILAVQEEAETVFRPVFNMNEVAERIGRGDWCFVCEDKGRLLGYVWFTSGEKYIVETQVTLKPQNKEAYAYNGYVRAEYRGTNMLRCLLITASRHLLGNGFKRGIGAVMRWNRPTHNILPQMGFSQKGHIKSGYFLTVKYTANTCKDITFSSEARPFELYTKMARKLGSAFSRLEHRGLRQWRISEHD